MDPCDDPYMYIYIYTYTHVTAPIFTPPSAPVSCRLKSNNLDLHGRASDGGRAWELGSLGAWGSLGLGFRV